LIRCSKVWARKKLGWREPTGQHSENSEETIANSVLSDYTKITGKQSEKRKKSTIYSNQKNSKC